MPDNLDITSKPKPKLKPSDTSSTDNKSSLSTINDDNGNDADSTNASSNNATLTQEHDAIPVSETTESQSSNDNDLAATEQTLDKSLRLNLQGSENLVHYSYVAPDSLSFFRTADFGTTTSEEFNDNSSDSHVSKGNVRNGDDYNDDDFVVDSFNDSDITSNDTASKPSTSDNLAKPYPYFYTSAFIMHCLANQIAHAEPEPDIAIATYDPETLGEEEIPYVTSDSVVPSIKDHSNPKNKSKPEAPTDSELHLNKHKNSDKSTSPESERIEYDSLLRQSTPAGIDQTCDTLHSAQQIKNNNTKTTVEDKSSNDNSSGNNHNPTTIPKDYQADKPQEEKTTYDDLVKKARPKDEEEIRAEKESKLESYKQFVAKQESEVDIDYPAIRVSIEANALPSRMYFIMNALSAVIASYGLVMNSAAVVIGAMLVAMMLGPISGSALAIIDYRIPLLRKSIATVLAGIGMVVFIGYIIGLIHEGRPLTNEILSRTQPTSMDLMVALAGGTAGAYAMISPHLSVAVVGVAVATALVPPLAASGILFANGEMTLGLGALLLAITNIIAIQFTNGLVLWFAGFRRLMSEDYKKGTHFAFFRRNAVPLLLLTGIGIYLSYNLNNIATRQKFENEVTTIIEDYFIDKDNMLSATQFINKEDHLTIRAVITGQTRPNSTDVKYLENKVAYNMSETTPDLPDIQLQLRYIPVVVIESTPRTDDTFGKTDAAILSTEQ